MDKIRFTKAELIKFDARVSELRNRAAGLYDALLERDWELKDFRPRTDRVGEVYKAWRDRWSFNVPRR